MCRRKALFYQCNCLKGSIIERCAVAQAAGIPDCGYSRSQETPHVLENTWCGPYSECPLRELGRRLQIRPPRSKY